MPNIDPFDTNTNLTAEQQTAVAAVREAYKTLNSFISLYVPASRERAVAVTELETSAMWAIKGITHG